VFASLGAAGFARRTRALLDDVPEVPLWSVLTERGREIARRVTRGETNRQIASALGLSEKTVEFHLGKVFRTLRVSSRAGLAGRVGALDE